MSEFLRPLGFRESLLGYYSPPHGHSVTLKEAREKLSSGRGICSAEAISGRRTSVVQPHG